YLRQKRPPRSVGRSPRRALSVCSGMASAAAVVTPSGLEDGVSRSRGEGAGEVVVERGPGAAYHMFVVMEDLVEKLKLLRFEEELLRKSNLKPPSRWVPLSLRAWVSAGPWGAFLWPRGRLVRVSKHYFALPTNPGEQFYMFCTLAAWLINKAGRPFEQPQEYDDPNATISNVLSELRSFEEETDNEENFIDLNVLKAQTYRLDMNESAKQEDILESTTDAAEWSLEVERVLPQLKVTIRTDNKDWRIHVDQMHQHKSGIESALKETK
ncbi:Intraflagellar transport protein 57, partial [Galemys pyrenaicus]